MLVDLSKITSGFSDKLRAVTFYIALNNLKLNKKSNVFYIYEKKTKECPFRFIDYCKIKNIKIIKLKKLKKSLINLDSYNTEISLKNVIKNNPYKSINNVKLYNEWKKSYKKILPLNKILEEIKKIKLPKNSIGLHLRTTDRTLKLRDILKIQFNDTIYNFQLEYFMKNVDKILAKNSSIKNIYIAADSKQIKNIIINKLKNLNYNVYYNRAIFRNKFRKTNGKDFLIDFFALLECRLILSTVGAGVTQSINLMKEKKIINWNNQFNKFILLRIFSLLILNLKKYKKLLLKSI